MDLKNNIVELIKRASTDLSEDVEKSLKDAFHKECDNTPAKNILATILENIDIARKNATPLCQDTGYLLFFVDIPYSADERIYKENIINGVRIATSKQYLRPNAVDSITGKNSGDNTGINAPYIHFSRWDRDDSRIRLLLKGGGSENVGTQYRLPDTTIKAGRDLKGVKNAIIDAVVKAQGQGCAPGIIGVGIGGDRFTSYGLSKEQFFRKIGERSNNEDLAKVEKELLEELNSLNIGPMGLGGKTTVLDVFIGYQHRHPATFYVAVSYMCWAFRRKSMTIKNNEVYYD
jgi:fumarate hydratase class I